jgi:hypothetical protein
MISSIKIGTSYFVNESTDSEVVLSFHLPFKIESSLED